MNSTPQHRRVNDYYNWIWHPTQHQLVHLSSTTGQTLLRHYLRQVLHRQYGGKSMLDPSSYIPEFHTLCDGLIDFMNENYGPSDGQRFMPYSVRAEDDQLRITRDSNQYVRNSAMMLDILRLHRVRKDTTLKQFTPAVIEQVRVNLLQYLKIYENNQSRMRQASAFLLLALHELQLQRIQLGLKNTSIENLKTKMVQYILENLRNMEKNFELGECLIALAVIVPLHNRIVHTLCEEQISMAKRLAEYASNNEIPKLKLKLDDIFWLNWHGKYVFFLMQRTDLTEEQKNKLHEHRADLLTRIINLSTQFTREAQYETNYIAVCFEALCSLLHYLDDKIKYLEAMKQIQKLSEILRDRQNKYKLYEFLNNSARLDISGHVLNGYMALLKGHTRYL